MLERLNFNGCNEGKDAFVLLLADTEDVRYSFHDPEPLLGKVVFSVDQLQDADQDHHLLTLVDGLADLFAEFEDLYRIEDRGEFFPSSAKGDGSRTFVNFFQTDKDTGKKKGILRIRLR